MVSETGYRGVRVSSPRASSSTKLSADCVAGVDDDRRASDEIRRAGGKKNRGAGAFVRRAETSGRRALEDLIIKGRDLIGAVMSLSIPSGHDRVDLNIVRREFDRLDLIN